MRNAPTEAIAGTYGCKSCPRRNMTMNESWAHAEECHPELIEHRTADTPEKQANLAAGLANMAALRQQFAHLQKGQAR